MAEMIAFLAHYYGFSPETAAEIPSELRDPRSLQTLVAPRPIFTAPAQDAEAAQ